MPLISSILACQITPILGPQSDENPKIDSHNDSCRTYHHSSVQISAATKCTHDTIPHESKFISTYVTVHLIQYLSFPSLFWTFYKRIHTNYKLLLQIIHIPMLVYFNGSTCTKYWYTIFTDLDSIEILCTILTFCDPTWTNEIYQCSQIEILYFCNAMLSKCIFES